MIVELRYAPLPFIGLIARHYWFVVFEDSGGCHRWEVWQTKNAGGLSIGHVHCDLKAPDAGVGGGPAVTATQWSGEEARRIAQVLDAKAYPFTQKYRLWPGPNSNSFAAWVLREAGIQYRLDRRAIGRGYLAKR